MEKDALQQQQQHMLDQWIKDNQPMKKVAKTTSQQTTHALALEGSLLAFQMHLSNMPQVEQKMEIAAEDKENRQRFWQTYHRKLSESFMRLETQLELTQSYCPELADDTRKALVDILQTYDEQQASSKHHKATKIMHAWNAFVETMKTVLSTGAPLLPGVEVELIAVRSGVIAALQHD